MESRKTASHTLMQLLRKDTNLADVELGFKGGVILTAHAVVLSLTSDCYKEALTAKWTYGRDTNTEESLEAVKDEADLTLAHISKKRRTSSKPTGTKITLNHPNVQAETGKIVLDFLYLGDVEIPPSLVFSVIEFADEILAFKLVRKCVKYIAEGHNLSPENALKFYRLCERLRVLEDTKSYALSKMLLDLPSSLECGRAVLARMNEKEVESLLLSKQLEPIDRWRILIAWCKACHGTEGDLSLESKLPPGFQIDAASNLIEPLLPVVELLKIPANCILLEPFMALLPKSVQDIPVFHIRGRTQSGGIQWKATLQIPMDITRTAKDDLPVPSNSQPSSDPVLLFHGKEGTYTESQLHKAYDGKTNTLTLIKLKTGSIFAGFSAIPLMGHLLFRQGSTASMFLTAPSGTVYCFSDAVIGLNIDFRVDGHALTARKRKHDESDKHAHRGDDEDARDEGYEEMGGCEFINDLSATGEANSAIEDYQVLLTAPDARGFVSDCCFHN